MKTYLIKLVEITACDRCDGDGAWEQENDMVTCAQCDGKGVIPKDIELLLEEFKKLLKETNEI